MSVEILIVKGSIRQIAEEIRRRNHLTWKQLHRLFPKLPFQLEEEKFKQFCERNHKAMSDRIKRIKDG